MSTATYPVWLIPRGKVLVREDGPTWDFDAEATDPSAYRFTWADAVRSVTEWVAAMRPPVLMEHEEPAQGEAVPVWGHVVEAFALTTDEAAAAGIEATDLTDALYARVRPGPDLADLRGRGKVGLGSPGLQAAFTDDTGRKWPLVVWEYSHTYAPRQRSRQPTPESMLAASLSDPTRGKAMAGKAKLNEAAEVVEDAVEAAVEEQAAEAPDLAAALMAVVERLTALEAMITAMSAPPAEMADETPADDDAAAPITMSDVDRIVAKQLAVAREVDALRRTHIVTDADAAMLSDLRGKPAHYAWAVGKLPRRKAATVVGLADSRPTAPLSERVQAMADAKGIKFSEALALATKGGV